MQNDVALYLSFLYVAFLQDLLHHILLLVCSKLVLQHCIACRVHHALSAVPSIRLLVSVSLDRVIRLANGRRQNALMCNKHLPATDDLSQRNGLVILPVSYGLRAVGEYDEVFFLALEVDFGLGSVSTSHIG